MAAVHLEHTLCAQKEEEETHPHNLCRGRRIKSWCHRKLQSNVALQQAVYLKNMRIIVNCIRSEVNNCHAFHTADLFSQIFSYDKLMYLVWRRILRLSLTYLLFFVGVR